MPVTEEQGGVAEHHMYRPPQQQEPQVTLDDILGRLKTGMPRIPGLGGGGVSLISPPIHSGHRRHLGRYRNLHRRT